LCTVQGHWRSSSQFDFPYPPFLRLTDCQGKHPHRTGTFHSFLFQITCQQSSNTTPSDTGSTSSRNPLLVHLMKANANTAVVGGNMSNVPYWHWNFSHTNQQAHW
jgi:hypothetical protein